MPTLKSNPLLAPIVEAWQQRYDTYDPQADAAQYLAKLAQWEQENAQATAEGKPAPQKPRAPQGPRESWSRPAGLYNAMIAPLMPFAIRGAIWYQGEGNGGRGWQYRTLFPAMITNWRTAWGQGDFPFLFVQLPNFGGRTKMPGKSGWSEVREAQARTLSLPNTGMAITIDIGEANNIHPLNKQDVGHRLALVARAKVYGEKIPYSGPLFRSMQINGNQATVRFTHADGGLVAKDGPVKGFAIAGKDQHLVWANARIEGDRVVVWSDEVTHPVAVRYAWADNPECNLYNGAGLPAAPFRTDDWPDRSADAGPI